MPRERAAQAQGTGAVSEPDPIRRGAAPWTDEYGKGFDAIDYDITLTVPSTGSVIEGQAKIRIAIASDAPSRLPLDLTGLAVTRVLVSGAAAAFQQKDGKLLIPLPDTARGRRVIVTVDYRGTPDDGLQIHDNVHGERVAFADNWPNRARFWFPAIDQPADKATVSFNVIVPAGWNVVANGERVGPAAGVPRGDARLFRWRMMQPVSTYNMVVGAGVFSVRNVGRPCMPHGRCVDVSTWLFPQSADKGAGSFRRAGAMVEYFSGLIAPFPYAKLAHVQSSTEFEGMENATAIFYPEKLLSEGGVPEDTVAHETAHQWFGDAVTERDWHDLWLSEGFATYFAALFVEHADGVDAFRKVMEASRQTVITSRSTTRPIVDPTERDLLKLLNSNNYSKASWVLHMLRGQMGDTKFFEGIRRYYRQHEHGTAGTADLQRAMEEVAGTKLENYFAQWVFKPGYPRLRVTWQWDAGMLAGVVEQTQAADWPTYRLPLTLEVTASTGQQRHRLDIDERTEAFTIPMADEPSRVVVDPDGWLLKEIEAPVP